MVWFGLWNGRFWVGLVNGRIGCMIHATILQEKKFAMFESATTNSKNKQ